MYLLHYALRVSFYVQALVWPSLMFRQMYVRVFFDAFRYTFITPS